MLDQRDVAGSETAAGTGSAEVPGGHRRIGEWIAAAAILVAGVAVVALLLVRTKDATRSTSSESLPRNSASVTASLPAATASTASTVSTPSTGAVETTVASVPPTSAPPVTANSVVAETVAPPAATTAPVRYAVFDHGKVYMRGKVPTAAIAQELIDKAGKVVGPENVVNEYTIEAGTPAPKSAPLYVADTVLFDTGSSVVRPEFAGLLDLGVVLLTQNPNVTIIIIGHTDSMGDEQMNLELSQRRVDAALAYLGAKGVDLTTRVTGIAKGESEPIGDNATAEGRRLNRRVEFVVNGLLD